MLSGVLPTLIAAYASQSIRQRIRLVNSRPLLIRFVSGGLLIGFGIYILTAGMLAIGMSTTPLF